MGDMKLTKTEIFEESKKNHNAHLTHFYASRHGNSLSPVSLSDESLLAEDNNLMISPHESLPMLHDLQELRGHKRAMNEMCSDLRPCDNYCEPPSKKTRPNASESTSSITFVEEHDYTVVETICSMPDVGEECKTARQDLCDMYSSYNNTGNFTSTVTYNPSTYIPNNHLISHNNNGAPKLRVYLVPQEKGGKSRNFDYMGGTVSEDPDSEYSVYCRGRPTVVPFALGLQNVSPQDVKLKVQVIFSKIQNKVPVRCSNHKEGDDTIWRDQLLVCTDPTAQALSYVEGHGFMLYPVPPKCDVIFLCRNSCRQGCEKDWSLKFTLLDSYNSVVATRVMNLRVCEVPHRDIARARAKFEWDAASSSIFNPVMKLMPGKSEAQVETTTRMVTDVYPIYVSGYNSYYQLMQYVGNLELRKKDEDPILHHSAGLMSNWTRDTPIIHLLQIVCGRDAMAMEDKFRKSNIRTLGDLYFKFTSEYFNNMQIPPIYASQLSSLYLNWRNIIEYFEMGLTK